MKRSSRVGLATVVLLALVSTVSYATDFGRWWQPKYNAQERAIPQGQEHARKLIQESISNPLGIPPAIQMMNLQIQNALKESQEYAKKKAECKDEITVTMNKLFKMGGSLGMDSGSIDATLAADYPQKCADVHVCDKNGEVTPFTPADPKFLQTPTPYIYGKWTCVKDVAYDTTSGVYLNYKVSAPLLCNSQTYPASGGASKISFIYGEKVPPQVILCKATDAEQKGTTYNEIPFFLAKYFSVTTVEVFVGKMEALYKSQGKAVPIEYLKSNYGPEGLKLKACMLSFPQQPGPDWASGAIGGQGTTFPPNYVIAELADGHKVNLESIQTVNASFDVLSSGKKIAGLDPDMCEIKFTIK